LFLAAGNGGLFNGLSSTFELIYAKRRIRTLSQEGLIDEDMHIRVTTNEQVKRQGVTAKIWEEC
jgi:hypothetical protein